MPQPRRVIVIGGGISGLACAYRLKRLGIDVTLLESAERAGGLVASARNNGFLFESGPQSFQGTPAVLGLIRELGIESEILRADPRAPRFLLRAGRLQRLPMSPPALLATPVLGLRSRWKILSEPFRRTRPPDREESIAEFTRRKFGGEILDYFVSPFVSGIYAGDPEKLSLAAAFPMLDEWERKYGSILRGAIKSMKSPAPEGEKKGMPPLCSFRGGLATLIGTLSRQLADSVQFGTCADCLKVNGTGRSERYGITAASKGQSREFAASAVVLATPAYVAAELVGSVSSSLSAALASIRYAAVAVVAAGYDAKQFPHPPSGFGFLIPRNENFRTLGTVWNSSLFPGVAPEGHVLMTSFIGGATDPDALAKSESELVEIVNGENARIMGFTGRPIASATWKHHKALPQYNLGHGRIVENVRTAERELPGLFFSGNYLNGPAIGKCVEQAFRTADAVRDYLHTIA